MRDPSSPTAVDLAIPRFDLRFEAGLGRLVLRRPVPAFPAELGALTLSVPLPGRIDLAGGADRLRHMRSTLEAAELEVRWRAAVKAAEGAGVRIALRGLRGGRLALALRDAAGVISAELDVLADGVDLVFGLRRMDWVRPAPTPALERLSAGLGRLGLRWMASDGVFHLRRPLRSLLAEVLLPSGFRLPEERALGLRLEVKRRGVVFRAEGSPTAADLDRYRRLVADPPDWLEAAGQRGEAPMARTPIEDLPSPWLRGDAIRARVERRLVASREALGAEEVTALLDALSLHRRDVALWSEWVERLGERGDPAVLRLAAALLELPLAERDALVAAALTRAARAGVAAAALAPVLERAERAAAGSPHLWALRAELSDDDSQAAELWTRAAAEVDDAALAARWLRSAAARLDRLRGPEAALPLARRACEAAPADVHAALLLTELLDALDRPDALEDAFSRLLDLEPADDDADEAWQRGLARAAAFHVQRGEEDAARPFLAAMDDRPSFPTAPGSLEAPDEELELEDDVDDDDGDWPKSEIWEAPPKDLADEDPAAFDEDWSPSEVWDAEPRIADQGEDGEGPESGTHQAPPRPSDMPRSERTSDVAPASDGRSVGDAPMVTQVGVADDELRALLEDVGASEDPAALLEGALEDAFDEDDEEAVRRVLMVLDRITTLPGPEPLTSLRRRALEWLAER